MTIPLINRGRSFSPTRTPLIAANWKMNKTVDAGLMLVENLLDDLDALVSEGIEVVLCPPFPALYPILDLLEDTQLSLGAQNMYFEESGAFTGEISPLMLRELCDYVILGHSERRTYFAETDEIVNKKVKAALGHDIRPIICIGENEAQRARGLTPTFVGDQLRAALKGISSPDLPSVVVAYEPLWAIGTGKNATGEIAQEVCGLIRQILTEQFNGESAQQVRVLYGGSVTSKNIEEFFRQKDIDGALVGGASLKEEEFVQIVAKGLASQQKK